MCDAFDDGGFTDAWFADENRVVFASTGENLDDAANFSIAPDDGIDLPQSREFNQVFPVLLQRLVFVWVCLLYTSPSPRDLSTSRMPSSA